MHSQVLKPFGLTVSEKPNSFIWWELCQQVTDPMNQQWKGTDQVDDLQESQSICPLPWHLKSPRTQKRIGLKEILMVIKEHI